MMKNAESVVSRAAAVLPGFFRYWGKAGEADDPRQCHLLALHSLDVAAVGDALVGARPAWIDAFAAIVPVNRWWALRLAAP